MAINSERLVSGEYYVELRIRDMCASRYHQLYCPALKLGWIINDSVVERVSFFTQAVTDMLNNLEDHVVRVIRYDPIWPGE